MPRVPGRFWTAVLTPFAEDFSCDVERLAAHCRDLVEQGCDGVALFGTTGEGPAVGTLDRQQTLDALLDRGFPAERLIVSASTATLPESAELARHATRSCGCPVLVMPPFLFRDGIGDEGVFRYYATLIDRVAEPNLRVILYHIPGVSGVPLRPPVIRRLIERYPDVIVGIKDSGGDWDYTEELIRRFSRLAVFTGSEMHIHLSLRQQGAGTICGLGNVIAPLLRLFADAPDITARRRLLPHIQRADTIMSRGPFVACLKAWMAALHGDPGWNRLLPPMSPLVARDAQRISKDFQRFLAECPATAEAAA
ncbi:MAG: dihydrodipicolinate synthase family protein [Alsobacter sp.]